MSKRAAGALFDSEGGENIRYTGARALLYSVGEASNKKEALATGSPYALA
ncbi:MAG: hypothetical protein AAF900_02155 [Bacteroidota bacterium]